MLFAQSPLDVAIVEKIDIIVWASRKRSRDDVGLVSSVEGFLCRWDWELEDGDVDGMHSCSVTVFGRFWDWMARRSSILGFCTCKMEMC